MMDDDIRLLKINGVMTDDFFYNKLIQVSQVRELIEVKEVITPYGRSGS